MYKRVKTSDPSILNQNLIKKLVNHAVAVAAVNAVVTVLAALLSQYSLWGVLVVVTISVLINLKEVDSLKKIFAQSIGSISQENNIISLNLKNAKLNALVSQLNPHFLFNALQLLQDEILNGEKETSCAIVMSLSNMFRYSSFNAEAVVRLRDELSFARDYLSVCEQLYEGNLSINICVPESLGECTVPKFILQPILENAIKHGFDGAPYKNSIRLSVQEGPEELLIEIADDGKGVTPEQLKYMQQSCTENKSRGIGLHNVHQRICLICGEAYGISLYMREPHGLSVVIRLPRILKPRVLDEEPAL
ncbi:histidine kinase [uncultured Oscillibacter sp.]|uniref:sensor histidine kinase n=1 Tax=uncultured Oscillibacter sp. TaxID=876091 RepID=UPI0028064567|nr:histidine kinase [uncultured Oscillibacter sp.]